MSSRLLQITAIVICLVGNISPAKAADEPVGVKLTSYDLATYCDLTVDADGIRHPMMGVASRPNTLQVGSGGDWEKLQSQIEELGIELEVCEELEPFDDVFAELVAHIGGEHRPGLLKMLG